ncbi:MAG: PASTA domain-containing protein [Acidimicrobiales bacterium]
MTALVSLLVLALIAGGVTAAVVRYGVYGHTVPALVGDDLVSAQAAVDNAGLKLLLGQHRYDLGVPSGHVISQSLGSGKHERAGTVIVVSVSKGPAPVRVVNVDGLGQQAALASLTKDHLTPVVAGRAYSETVGIGKVISESPDKGLLRRDTKVSLVVSRGPHPRLVPDLRGLTYAKAAARLESEQLKAVQGPGVYSTSVGEGEVVSISPKAGETATRYSVVSVTLSLGPPIVSIPHLDGLKVSKAVALLKGLGLKTQIFGPAFGDRVFASDPSSGAKIREGQTVTLYVI